MPESLFLIKLQTVAQTFSCEFGNTFSGRAPPVAASASNVA